MTVAKDGIVTVANRAIIGTTTPLTTGAALFVQTGGLPSGWSGSSFFGGTTAGVIAGQFGGYAHLGGHTGSLGGWADLNICPAGNCGVGKNVPTVKLDVAGSIAANGTKPFKIKHPLPGKNQTHFLVHTAVEGPQVDCLYRGKVRLVNGQTTVNIDEAAGMTDGTFIALLRDVQCFTSNESNWVHIRGRVEGNLLLIEAQDPTATSLVSWMVLGERKDEELISRIPQPVYKPLSF